MALNEMIGYIRSLFGEEQEEEFCPCCYEPKLYQKANTDPTLWLWSFRSPRPMLFDELTLASEEGCQNCRLVLDAIVAWSNGHPLGQSCQFEFSVSYPDGLKISFTEDVHGCTAIQVIRIVDGPRDFWRTYGDMSCKIKEISSYTADPPCNKTLGLIEKWTRDCENHKPCKERLAHSFPKRILEITTGSIYLREGLEVSAKYACLSHYWDDCGPPIELKHANMGSFEKGYGICKLPEIIRDVVEVCQSLELDYLWIDALCIVQDSPEDRKEAEHAMTDVYENAYITFATASVHNGQEGIFSQNHVAKRLSKYPEFYVRPLPPSPSANYQDFFGHNQDVWPLLRRTWSYQKLRLSPRTVYFRKYQVYWKCQCEFKTQDGHEQMMPEDPQSLLWQDWAKDAIVGWHEVVLRRSRAHSTNERNHLSGLEAIADQMSRLRKADDVYIAGMWKNSMLYDLWWSPKPDNLKPRPEGTMPSWSWASIQATPIIWWPPMSHDSLDIVSLDYDISGAAYLGDVKQAKIVLRGPILAITGRKGLSQRDLSDISDKIPAVRKKMLDALRRMLQPHGFNILGLTFYQDYDLKTAVPPFELGTSLKIVLTTGYLNEVMGLVLRQLRKTSLEYERIGLIRSQIRQPLYDSSTRLMSDCDWSKEKMLCRQALDVFMKSLLVEDLKIV